MNKPPVSLRPDSEWKKRRRWFTFVFMSAIVLLGSAIRKAIVKTIKFAALPVFFWALFLTTAYFLMPYVISSHVVCALVAVPLAIFCALANLTTIFPKASYNFVRSKVKQSLAK